MRFVPPRVLAALVPLLLAVPACAGTGGEAGTSAGGPGQVAEEPVSGSPTPHETGGADQGHADDPEGDGHDDGDTAPGVEDVPVIEQSPPVRSKPSPPAPGEPLPVDRAGPLRFWEIRVYEDGGTLRIHANVTNESAEYLNGVSFSWRALRGGSAIDRGTGTIQAIAPGETTTVDVGGGASLDGNVDRVDFELTG